jgi:hypothetical protein
MCKLFSGRDTRTTAKYYGQLNFDFRAIFLPTLKADPSVFFIFPTALFLIQFLTNPHWHIGLCPDTQSQRFGKSQRADFADLQVRFSETNRIFAEQ